MAHPAGLTVLAPGTARIETPAWRTRRRTGRGSSIRQRRSVTIAPFAITAEGRAAVRRHLLGNLAAIEVNPADKALQAEFLERRRVFLGHDDDQRSVDEERARVRNAIRPVAKRKVREPAAPQI